MTTPRTYGGYTLEQIEKMGGDNPVCIAYALIVRIRELEADLARLAAERNERWPAIEVPKRGGVHINDETDKVTAILWGDIKRDPEGYGIIAGGPTPAAALQALKDKIGGGR